MRKTVSIEKLPGGYSVRYWAKDSSGAYHRKRQWMETWEEARKYKLEKEQKLLSEQKGQADPTLRPIDIFRLYLQTLSHNPEYRQSTLDFKYDSLNSYLIGLKSMGDLYPKKFLDYLQTTTYRKNKHYSPNTVALRLRDLKAFNRWCVNEGYLDNDLFTTETSDGKKRKFVIPAGTEVGRKLEIEEIQRLWEASSPKYRLFLAFLIYHGSRFGETHKAEWQHIDLKKGIWTIPAENNKTDREKIVPLDPFVLGMLQQQPVKEGRLFPKWNMRRYLDEAKKKAGITGRLRTHDLRHTFASHWEGDARILMDMLGWTTTAMLKKYSHFNVEDIRKAARTKGIGSTLSLNP